MRIGNANRITLLLALSVASALLAGGSPRLALSAAGLFLVSVLSSFLNPERTQSNQKVIVVHIVTLVALFGCIFVVLENRVDGGLMIVVLGLINRRLLRSNNRDDLIIFGGCTVLMAAGTLITPGILYLPLFVIGLVSVLFGMWSSMLLFVSDGVQEATRVQARAQMAQRSMPKGMRWVAIASVGFMILGFVIMAFFPRYRFGRLFRTGYLSAAAGTSPSSMTLDGEGVRGGASDSIIARVEPHPQATRDLEGMYLQLYAMSEFDGREWRGLQTSVGPIGTLKARAMVRRFERTPKTTVRVTLTRQAVSPQPEPVARLGFEQAARSLVPAGYRTASGTWFHSARVGHRAQYLSDLSLSADAPASLDEEAIYRASVVPESVSDRVRTLAMSLIDETNNETPQKLHRILQFLREGFQYSLNPLSQTDDPPLERFLFRDKRGHCELYAGALALLLRLSGVPARVATGFYGGRWNAVGGYLAYSAEDAHAWVEYFDGEEWRWADATPPSARWQRASFWGFAGDVFEAMEMAWFNHVVEFDNSDRQALIQHMKQGLSFEMGLRSRSDAPVLMPKGLVLWLLLGGVLFVFGVLIWVKKSQSQDLQKGLGPRLRRLLGATHPAETLGLLLSRLPDARRAEASVVVGLYQRRRFGPELGAPSVKEIHQAIRRLEAVFKAERAVKISKS